VEVDRGASRPTQNCVRQHLQVGDAEQVVEVAGEGGREVALGVEQGDAAPARPGGDRRLVARDAADLVAALDQDLGALHEQRLRADQVAAETTVDAHSESACPQIPHHSSFPVR
jgi:hypothetical protein